ncbi:hypothetical protein [Azospirillum sp. TSO22-1]|uniref:hypothetical protein n=1 Tax=Azospirillum sp. TSO22-1 TaxID=716789 RepID=UPI0018EEA416|nr:hypothetical protein [Azospirillum sp. TSO22-1]
MTHTQFPIPHPEPRFRRPAACALAGFLSGFLAVLVFHQGMVGLLHLAGIVARAPFQLQPVPPLGVPAVLSSAFWGGVWGVALAGVAGRFPRGAGYWLAAAAFGALGPTLVAWFVVQPLKGLPSAGGWSFPGVLVGPLVNGAWGVGAALALRMIRRK